MKCCVRVRTRLHQGEGSNGEAADFTFVLRFSRDRGDTATKRKSVGVYVCARGRGVTRRQKIRLKIWIFGCDPWGRPSAKWTRVFLRGRRRGGGCRAERIMDIGVWFFFKVALGSAFPFENFERDWEKRECVR